MGKKRLHRLSRVFAGVEESGAMMTESERTERGYELLWEAQQYWLAMERFRRDRERNKNYYYGRQWEDIVCVEGEMMTEEDYIRRQGNIPLKNNLIRRMVRAVLGVYRSQSKEPTCTARDRNEQ